MTDETVSDRVANAIRDARKLLGWRVVDLAAACARDGHPELTADVLGNIESGRRDSEGRRRRLITVDELRALADVLGFSPADVLGGLPQGAFGAMSVDRLETLIAALQDARSFMKYGEPVPASKKQPVVVVIVTSPKGVLMGRRNDAEPPWGFISGEIEPGELPEDAAIREVKEETGLEVRAGHVIGERDHPRTRRHLIYMTAVPVRGTEVFVGDRTELDEVRWVSLAEADELTRETPIYGPVHEHLERELGGTQR